MSKVILTHFIEIKLCVVRGYQRILGDISAQATTAMVNISAALIIGSIFFGTPDATIGFYSRGSVLFLGVLMSALTAISEISSLYDQRPVVEKHNAYAYYHPWTEAAAGIVCDLPVKFVIAVCFNVVCSHPILMLYASSNWRRSSISCPVFEESQASSSCTFWLPTPLHSS
jgi:ABC-type multidrug transport system permease subunit